MDLLGICGASSVSEYYDVHLDDLVLTPGAKPLPISEVVSLLLRQTSKVPNPTNVRAYVHC